MLVKTFPPNQKSTFLIFRLSGRMVLSEEEVRSPHVLSSVTKPDFASVSGPTAMCCVKTSHKSEVHDPETP